jgi:hypothetical protein
MVERHRITPLLKLSGILVGLPPLMQRHLERHLENVWRGRPSGLNLGDLSRVEQRCFPDLLRALKIRLKTLEKYK